MQPDRPQTKASPDVIIDSIDSLAKAKHSRDLDRVEVRTARFKCRGLLPHALKYGLWALRPGGTLVVQDDGPALAETWEMPFAQVRRLTFKVLGTDAALSELEPSAFRLIFTRTRPLPEPGWSAGLIFSGNDGELPALARCLDGLFAQPELAGEAGEVLVCGPKRDLGFLAPWPKARYVEYETPPGPRFMISAKKNFLATQFRYSRILVLHARIRLDAGCLGALPREFDVVTPAVHAEVKGKRCAYLDYVISDATDPNRMARRFNVPIDYPRRRYHHYLAQGEPYIDGGLFIARRDILLNVPLDANLGWAEGEDSDWCRRVRAAGFLVDLAHEAGATTDNNKMGRSVAPSAWDLIRRPIRRPLRALSAWGTYMGKRLKGER
jgi:hypothetical protein